MKKEELKENILNTLKKLNINCKLASHEPILNFEIAAKVDEELGWTGKETKSLFVKGKSGKFYIYITTEDQKLDSKRIKALIGEKVNIVSSDEMTEIIGCVPGSVAAFGYINDIVDTVIVDKIVLDYDAFICSIGVPDMSAEISTKDLDKILNYSYPNVLYLEKE
ncbi:MAG: YbaK/EbsC family protein [Bacilli bacterium]